MAVLSFMMKHFPLSWSHWKALIDHRYNTGTGGKNLNAHINLNKVWAISAVDVQMNAHLRDTVDYRNIQNRRFVSRDKVHLL